MHRTVLVLPAFNAASTLKDVVRLLDPQLRQRALLVDDASSDETVAVARSLGLEVIEHETNRGYGANQKTCYRSALERGADFVVMLHPDDQYDPRLVWAALFFLYQGTLDVVLGNRIRTRSEAIQGGMPRAKYFANRALTLLQNLWTGQNLGEWHSGFRAYRAEVLRTIQFERNSDSFDFDTQLLLQCVQAGFRLGDVPMPVRYHDRASSIALGAASRYALLTLWWCLRWGLHHAKLWRCALFQRS